LIAILIRQPDLAGWNGRSMVKQAKKPSSTPKTSEKRALSFFVREPDVEDSADQSSEGYFGTPRTNAWFKLYDLLDTIAHNSKTYKTYFSRLERIIEKHPDFLDAYNYCGDACLKLIGKEGPSSSIHLLVAAEEYYSRAFDRAKILIPPDFKGQIIWGSLENRPFLRAHSGLILCRLKHKDYAKAAQMIEEHLVWNPNDNAGVRYLLGDAYLMSGDTVNAKRALQKVAEEGYPDAHFSLGLLEFQAGNYTAAATVLRLGFVENMYIAEILTGRTDAKSHLFWHNTSHESVRQAKSYLFDLGMLAFWRSSEQAIDFVDWLFNCAMVMKEPLEWTEIKEGLTYHHDFEVRGVFIERNNALEERILKTPMMVQKVTDNRGAKRWPWERSRESSFLE
jgi:tetratricopeptide (TPR) repeat protein